MDDPKAKHIDEDKPSSRLQGIGAGMTVDEDISQSSRAAARLTAIPAAAHLSISSG
jgi:hypothetical protein